MNTDWLCFWILLFITTPLFLAFKFRLGCYFSDIFMVWFGIWDKHRKRGYSQCSASASAALDWDGYLAAYKAKIWASKWKEPSLFKTLDCLQSGCLLDGVLEGFSLTKLVWCCFIETSVSRVWRSDLILLNSFNTPRWTSFCHLVASSVASAGSYLFSGSCFLPHTHGTVDIRLMEPPNCPPVWVQHHPLSEIVSPNGDSSADRCA